MITQILFDFHYVTKLPITFLDPEGHIHQLLGQPHLKLDEHFKAKVLKTMTLTEIESKTSHYLISPFKENLTLKGYFIVGPIARSCHTCRHRDEEESHNIKPNTAYFKDILQLVTTKVQSKDNAIYVQKQITLKENDYIKQAISYIKQNYQQGLTLAKVSNHLNLNMCYFCALFKEHTGTNFSKYLNTLKIEKSKKLLEKSDYTIIDIAFESGFNSSNYFTMTFKKTTGLTPSEYRKRNVK